MLRVNSLKHWKLHHNLGIALGDIVIAFILETGTFYVKHFDSSDTLFMGEVSETAT